MKTLFLIFLLGIASQDAFGQQPQVEAKPRVIERVEIIGLAEDRLSPELRAEFRKLVGQPYDSPIVQAIAERLQIELPEYLVFGVPFTGPEVIVFSIQKIADNEGLKNNINERYVVDAVEVTGNFKSRISRGLNRDLQSMVGQRLDMGKVKDLSLDIQAGNAALAQIGLVVKVKLRPASGDQRVKVVYEVNDRDGFIGLNLRGSLYHSQQGYDGATLIPRNLFEGGSRKAGTFGLSVIADPDTLIESDTGFAFRYRKMVKRTTFNFDYTSVNAWWNLDSYFAGGPFVGYSFDLDKVNLHERRREATASASHQWLRPFPVEVTAGGFLGEADYWVDTGITGTFFPFLVPFYDRGLQGSLRFSQDLNFGELREEYAVRSAMESFGSELTYTRHQLKVDYDLREFVFPLAELLHLPDSYFKPGDGLRSNLKVNLLAGTIDGAAPMYQRFSLGNSETLRGWNKYEIDPLGGSRVLHLSVSTDRTLVAPFYDMGAIWDKGGAVVVRKSAGIRLSGLNAPKQFCKSKLGILCAADVTVGVPIRSDYVRPAVIVSVRPFAWRMFLERSY